MKQYYLHHGEFANMYSLVYAETAEEAAALESMGFERCTRAEALVLAKNERERRLYDGQFANYADSEIMPPAWYINKLTDDQLYDDYECSNHIWIKRGN